MKAIASRRRISGAIKGETIALVVVVAALIWWKFDAAEKERKEALRRQAAAFGELVKPPMPILPDSIKQMLPNSTRAEDPAARALVGKKLRVVHPGYFSELGGVPAYTAGDTATRFTFSELDSAAPGAELHPNEFTKMAVLGTGQVMFKPRLLPVDTDFEVIEAYTVTGQFIFGKPLVLKMRVAGPASGEYYVNAKAFPPQTTP